MSCYSEDLSTIENKCQVTDDLQSQLIFDYITSVMFQKVFILYSDFTDDILQRYILKRKHIVIARLKTY